MANDERDAKNKGSQEPAPGKGESTPPPPATRAAKESFLPEDSFLFEIDDVAARGPRADEPIAPIAAIDASDEWILVEDDALDSAIESAAEPVAAAPERAPSPPRKPSFELMRDIKEEDDTADPLNTMSAMAQELAPVTEDTTTDASEERVDEPVSDAAGPDRADATDVESEPLAPIAGLPATRKGVPSWLTDDDNELPSFVADDSDAESSAAAPAQKPELVHAAATNVDDSTPVSEGADGAEAPAAAPVLSLKRSRRSNWMAAAGLLVGLGLTIGGLYWWRQQSSAGTDEVALNSAPTKRAPTPKPKDPVAVAPQVPVLAPEQAPTLPEPTVAARVEESPAPAPVVEAPAPVVPEPLVVATPEPADPNTRLPIPAVSAAPVDLAPSSRIVDATSPIRPVGIPTTAPTPMDTAGLLARHGETIVELKNGHQFRGRVKRIKEGNITLGFAGGEFTFPLSEVEVLDTEAPEYRPLDQLPLASVVLHTGQRLRGRLLRETPEHVVLAFENGQLTVQRSEIKDVSFTGRIHF